MDFHRTLNLIITHHNTGLDLHHIEIFKPSTQLNPQYLLRKTSKSTVFLPCDAFSGT